MDATVVGDAFLLEGFRLDRDRGGLFRSDGDLAELGSRALDILQLLVERSGQLVPKQQIMDAVWPGLAVEESNLTVQISALRKVLDSKRAGASCIQTVPGPRLSLRGAGAGCQP
jgi:DNA-binding winged helix-turn-helix (wHTH) protein